MSDYYIILLLMCLLFFVVLIDSILYDRLMKRNEILTDRVDDLEKQLVTLAGNIARFMISTNNRIADLSTAFDCCDDNIDTLFDEKDKINESIKDLKCSVECVNCKLQNPLTRFIK